MTDPNEYEVQVEWQGGERFRGGPPDAPPLLLDASKQEAPGPVAAVVVALASCAGVDVAEILEKRRTPAESIRISARYTRAPTPPRRLREIHLRFAVATASEPHHVERAIELSFSKYCSVASSLAPDVQLSWEVVPDA